MMSNKPDFEQWALQILECSDDPTWLQLHISKELRKSWEAGYRYAVVNDWWQTQEKDGDPK